MAMMDAKLATVLPAPESLVTTGSSTPHDGTWLMATFLSFFARINHHARDILRRLSASFLRMLGQESWEHARLRYKAALQELVAYLRGRAQALSSLTQSHLERLRNGSAFRGVFEGAEDRMLLAAAASGLLTIAYLVRRRRLNRIESTSGLFMPPGGRVTVQRAVLIT
jgi:hypothetical protein